jgi:hypothetical protein
MKPNRSAILRWKARSATLASRLTMRLPLPSKLTSDWFGQSGLALPAFVCGWAGLSIRRPAGDWPSSHEAS